MHPDSDINMIAGTSNILPARDLRGTVGFKFMVELLR
jgi:hypothetical protein